MKIGYMFAGQGAQYPGMGKDLYENLERAREIFDTAGEQVKNWCFAGSKEELMQTHITQPCVYTVTMAAYEGFQERLEDHPDLKEKMEVSGLAGFSLGEYGALSAAGSIWDIKQGMDIVVNRGLWTNEAGLDSEGNQQGSMVAAIGERDAILECVDSTLQSSGAPEGEKVPPVLEAVNFNSPLQTVVAGRKDLLEAFKKNARERKIKAIPLKVGTAFHSAMMKPAAERLEEFLKGYQLKAPNFKVYSDETAMDYMAEYEGSKGDARKVSGYMARKMGLQAMSPVRWQEIVEKMIEDGTEAFVEFGPGNTLSGLVKKIDSNVAVFNVSDIESLEETMRGLEELKNA